MFGLHYLDIAALAFYLIGITLLGVWSVRKVKSLADFVMPRKFGKLMMMMHGFGTSTHSDQAVSVASKTATNGLSGIWYQWMWLLATPFYWLIAPMMRRFRALTTADVFEARYNRSVAMMYVVLGCLKFAVAIGTMLKGSSVIIDACSDGQLPEVPMIYVMTVLFVIYGVAGGLSAAIITDFVQGVLTILFSFMLLPMVLNSIGGIEGLHEALPRLTGRDDMLTLVAPGGITVFFVVVIAFNSLLGVVVQPHNMGTCGAGKTEIEGAVGFMGGSMIKRICTVAWCITGLGAIVYYGGSIEHPDKVYGMMAREFLPVGLLGVFIAALLATVMGSCDSFMVSAGGLLSENLYRPLLPGKSQRHYLWVARVGALLVVSVGVWVALSEGSVVKKLELMWKVEVMTAMAFWLGIFWRRATVAGAWAATAAVVVVLLVTSQKPFADWLAGSELEWISGLTRTSPDGVVSMWLPYQMLAYIISGFAVGIIVSLLTKPEPEEKLERFYGLLRTPVQPGEVITEPCHLPEGVEAAPRRVLFPNTNLEIPKPSVRAMAGFLVGWLIVAAIIGGVWLWVAV